MAFENTVKKFLMDRLVWQNAVILAVMLISNLPYGHINRPFPNLINMGTPLDDMIPFVPFFVVFYVFVFFALLGITIVFAFSRGKLFRPFAFSIIAVNAISYLSYMVLQSYVQRPDVTGTDFFSWVVRLVYSLDAPYNTFPSLHMAMMAVMVMFWYRIRPAYGHATVVIFFLVWASTLFLKQHYIVDGIFGAGLGFSAFIMFSRMRYRRLDRILR